MVSGTQRSALHKLEDENSVNVFLAYGHQDLSSALDRARLCLQHGYETTRRSFVAMCKAHHNLFTKNTTKHICCRQRRIVKISRQQSLECSPSTRPKQRTPIIPTTNTLIQQEMYRHLCSQRPNAHLHAHVSRQPSNISNVNADSVLFPSVSQPSCH